MTIAFTLEVVVGVALIVLPLLSTGVIPVSAHVSIIAPLGRPNATRPPDGHPSAGGISVGHPAVIPVSGPCVLCSRHVDSSSSSDEDSGPPTIGSTDGPRLDLSDSRPTDVVREDQTPKRVRISVIDEGQLMNKVEPVYPRQAIIAGIKGDVRMHAIIGRDGAIQSLTVISGHPLLIAAARDAVSQWRYRPYRLNGQPVEVETFITVSFKGIRD